MLLQPRNFKFKKIQKNRNFKFFKLPVNLLFGTTGLLILNSIRLMSTHINKFKLFLKKAVRNFIKTRRFFWFNSFPHLPLSRKSIGSRMGKGKGKLHHWFIKIRGGIILFELVNLRFGRSKYFIKQMGFKLNIIIKLISVNKKLLKGSFLKKQRILFNPSKK